MLVTKEEFNKLIVGGRHVEVVAIAMFYMWLSLNGGGTYEKGSYHNRSEFSG